MNGTAVHFGAGNIGRGFLGQLFTESGLEVAFVDVSAHIVDALNDRRSYPLYIVGDAPESIIIRNVRAIQGAQSDSVADEIARCAIVSTAVGAAALPHIAPTLASGLAARYSRTREPLNILLCENLHNAAAALREFVAQCLAPGHRAEILARTGFVQAVVSRMVPMQTEAERAEDLLAIRVEAYKRLPVDGAAVVGKLPRVSGIEAVSNFEAQVERKLYTHNCAHAVLGYLGCLAGHEYGYEALDDQRIGSLLRAVLAETSAALVRKHGFTPEEQTDHVKDLLFRFRNRALGDTCRRLARDPMRKLAPGDRLTGAARLCEETGVEPRALAWAIVAGLRHRDPDDPSACEVQRLMNELGRDGAAARICGIEVGEPLAALIREAFDATELTPIGPVL